MSSTTPDEHGPESRDRAMEKLSAQLPRFLRLITAARLQLSSDPRDRAALVLLYPLVQRGPLRQGALADHMHADPSTVSRHVAVLVEEGLVRRVADESDGRATRLVVTDAGRAAHDQMRRDAAAVLDRVTAGWDDSDLVGFTDLLGRFLDDLAGALPGDAASPPSSGDPR